MKKKISILFMLCIMATIISFNCKKSYAAVQYTDNVIPAMTSNTLPNGKVSTSSVWDSNIHCQPWYAFNHNTSNKYAWASNYSYGWLEYDFVNPKCITKYTITSRNPVYDTIGELPRDWTFEAWDDTTGKWTVLDKQTEVSDWKVGVKKEFTFTNLNLYSKYRINVTSSCSPSNHVVVIGELEMMETQLSSPINLTATPSNSNVALTWNAVDGATSYNIKRSKTAGGPYDDNIISSVSGSAISASGSAITFIDKNLKDGTYYYVVSANIPGKEGPNSNEASAIVKATDKKLKLVLEKNEVKQLSVSDDLSDNTGMTWTSSDQIIATVDENGMLKGLKPGNTVITCKNKDGSYIETINVLVVDLDYQLAVDLKIGETCRLTIDDLTNTTDATWTAYDPTIATVTSKGKVTAVSEGLTYVTVTDKEGKEIGRIYIRVRK